jgi:hypothetical protein
VPVSFLFSALNLFGRHLGLLAELVLLYAVLWGWGRGLGLPDLFWRATHGDARPRRWARGLVGLAVGLLLGTIGFVGLLVESPHHDWSSDAFLRGLRLWSLANLGLVLLVWAAGRYRRPEPDEAPSLTLLAAGLFPLGVLAGLVLEAVLVGGLPAWLGSAAPFLERQVARLPGPPLGRVAPQHAAAAALVALGFATYLALRILQRWFRVYPGTAIAIVLTVLTAVHGFVAFHFAGAEAGLYLLLALGLAVLNGLPVQRARLAGLDGHLVAREGTPPLLKDDDVLAAWRGRHARRPVLVVLATDGGGIRAALWTGVVLTHLERRRPDLADHLRLVTGASGGMLGATAWVATLRDPETAARRTPVESEALLGALSRGGLSAVAAGLVFRDLLPPPFRVGPDRGRLLEEAWERHLAAVAPGGGASPARSATDGSPAGTDAPSPAPRPNGGSPASSEGVRPRQGVFAWTFAPLAAGEAAGWRPSLVLSPMIVETGRRLVVSNLDLAALLLSEGPRLGTGGPRGSGEHDRVPYSRSGVQLFERLPAARETLRLSTAVRAQANFPYVLPSTELPSLGPGEPRLRVVDAGYYDNEGVDLAGAWIFAHRDWLRAETAGVLLVQIRDSPDAAPARPRRGRPLLAKGVDGVLTPPEAVLRSNESTMSHRNDADVAALARELNAGDPGFFTTALFELPVAAALSWSLTPPEIRRVRGALADHAPVIEAIDAWWRSRQT